MIARVSGARARRPGARLVRTRPPGTREPARSRGAHARRSTSACSDRRARRSPASPPPTSASARTASRARCSRPNPRPSRCRSCCSSTTARRSTDALQPIRDGLTAFVDKTQRPRRNRHRHRRRTRDVARRRRRPTRPRSKRASTESSRGPAPAPTCSTRSWTSARDSSSAKPQRPVIVALTIEGGSSSATCSTDTCSKQLEAAARRCTCSRSARRRRRCPTRCATANR